MSTWLRPPLIFLEMQTLPTSPGWLFLQASRWNWSAHPVMDVNRVTPGTQVEERGRGSCQAELWTGHWTVTSKNLKIIDFLFFPQKSLFWGKNRKRFWFLKTYFWHLFCRRKWRDHSLQSLHPFHFYVSSYSRQSLCWELMEGWGGGELRVVET